MDYSVVERYELKKTNRTTDKDTKSEEDKVKTKYYYTADGKKGIPSRAFYKALIRASSYLFEKKDGGMRNVREGLIILGDEILPVKYKSERVLTHTGRMQGKSRAPRKIMRNAFYDWEVTLKIQYNAEQLSSQQIFNLINWAGFHIGVGGFRRENSGQYGCFQVKEVV